MIDETQYADLLRSDGVLQLALGDAVALVGQLIDFVHDHPDPQGCERAIVLCNALLETALAPHEASLLHYYTANAWANRQTQGVEDDTWLWDRLELDKQILHLRAAALHPGYADLQPVQQCSVQVNLGNLLSHVGRFVDAIPYWENAASLLPDFGMATGNLGMGLLLYARFLSSRRDQLLFARRASQLLDEAIGPNLHAHALEALSQKRSSIAAYLESWRHLDVNLSDRAPDDTKEEGRYRQWCVRNRLFLNPLNDMTDMPLACQDTLTLPSIVVPIDDGPYYAGFFDQMKQEYVSARFLLWESSQVWGAHYSDRLVTMANTLDYPAYGLYTEKLRSSFRMAYSILDKVAFFLNHYLRLGLTEKSVSFRSLWYQGGDRTRGLAKDLADRHNFPLRGLYWLSKDLFEDRPGFQDSLEPDGRDLCEIRNRLEHRYVKLHLGDWGGPHPAPGFKDPLAHSIGVAEFRAKTLKLLRLVRSATVYLVLSAHCEEQKRAASRSPGAFVARSTLPPWEDAWKCPLA